MEGKYQAYPEYKSTNIEWLRSIPTHWEASYLGFECSVKARLGWKGLKAEEYVDEGFVFLATPNIKDTEIDFVNVDRITKERYDESPEIMLEEGDVLVTKDGSTTGTTNLVRSLPEPATVNSSIAVLRNKGKLTSSYLYYFFTSDYTQNIISRMRGGMGVPHLFQADLRKFNVLAPPDEEQATITNFLDHETVKIDTLIEKQQQLIKLLKEKRQAVISHAVTKGLNPDVPMRDSGVEWLGDVPEHWDVRRINLLYSENSNRAETKEQQRYPILRVSIHHGISDKEISEEESDRKLQRSDDRSLYKVVRKNYLAYNMMRAWQGGFGAAKVSGLVSPAYVVCKPTTSLNSDYFELVLRTSNAVVELKRFSKGITDFRLRLYWDEFKNIAVPVPPDDELNSILKVVIETSTKFDNLEHVASKQIELLQERRTALISAAVTGKIDVRNWNAPDVHES